MIVGFTGTRDGLTDAQRATLGVVLAFDIEPTVFHHGSCQGADVEAAQIVRYIHETCQIVCHPGPDGDNHRRDSGVDDEVLPPKTHFARNRDIVNACEILLVCPKVMAMLPYGGTSYTFRYATKTGKRTIVIWPDGSQTDSQQQGDS